MQRDAPSLFLATVPADSNEGLFGLLNVRSVSRRRALFGAAALLPGCCLAVAGGGPKRLRVMLEGESLLNDASGLTLFEVFFHLVSSTAARRTAACCATA